MTGLVVAGVLGTEMVAEHPLPGRAVGLVAYGARLCRHLVLVYQPIAVAAVVQVSRLRVVPRPSHRRRGQQWVSFRRPHPDSAAARCRR